MTRLTICIPTRNRQSYAMDAVRHMLASKREDFEILVADNSDDAAPLAEFVAERNDSRLRLLPPESKPLSMQDNWERMPQHARGEWLSIIGDDDYLDPELCEALRVTSERVPNADAFTWGRSYFVWPEVRPNREITRIPTGSHLIHMEKKELMKKMFFWVDAKDRPACPFGIYHGALKKELLDRIRDAFSNRYFEHPNADYDSICKTVMMADMCIYWERPLSVFGACKASNTAGLRDPNVGLERLKTVRGENEGGLEAEDFPFPIELGITASVGHTMEWFKQRYGIELNGWEEGFIKACAGDCESQNDRTRFEAKKAGYAAAIKEWRGAQALKQFNPTYKYRPDVPKFMGHAEGHLNFDMGIGNAQTAAEFYNLLDGMLFPVRLLQSRLAD
ncbi:MAG: glycosyltransferase family 2 protein [Hoeflea sp.]|uniref:glycosyltransferase family 2 protein n=1 Tax=Hoeflea sp. TaxID=1940281 RepID=UPI001E178C08|nr:glycosyltransferase family A protein [Hoeflea sp.]MBU4528876.1 glycosyltransferase family 2 protein [Alphaproteobacteria bacterium]MBU4544009.1 glycosyltransferase family 2 protein [Alphaproteobacteria bacterium]MBU4551878.1 glycosyltransferase family 2 protein [Alphaproteobacteria bacterium]MBV1723343.1 glycosyltransferase family 2 protein [Hoeflea sp.]MBV1760322.1 glycosyltransferase family 2 protein [Hoeflea sp.]